MRISVKFVWSIVLLLSVLNRSVAGNALLNSKQSTDRNYYEKGNQSLINGQFELARVYYDSAIKANPSVSDYYFARGQVKELLKDDISALDDFHAALKINPVNRVAHFKRALIYHKRGNYKQAVKDLTYLINNIEEWESTAIVYKGLNIDDNGDFELGAIHNLEQLMADLYEHRAKSYEKMGFKTPTLMDYDKAIEYNNHDPYYYVNRGQFKFSLGDKDGAISDYRAALRINQHHRAGLYHLSFLVSDVERDEINKVLYGQGDFAMAFSKRAFESFQKGMYKEALLDYDSALDIRSDNANDLMNRGIVKAKLDMHKEAIRDFKSSVYHDNTLIRNFVLLGNSYRALDNYRYSIEYYQRYLENAGPDAGVLYNLGLAYMKFQNDSEACQTFRKAIEMGEERAEAPMDDVCFE
ncbi:MAG: tetratricopeptide repeat protein [Reichenbachiella sp.]